MKESLVCSICEKNWKRDVTRGRKPTTCPSCLKKAARAAKASTAPSRKVTKGPIAPPAPPSEPTPPSAPEEAVQSKVKLSKSQVLRDYYPIHPKHEELLKSTKKGSLWFCKTCKQELRVNIALSAIPTHHCPKNSTRIKEYERVEEQ
jgi:hypothetical protein